MPCGECGSVLVDVYGCPTCPPCEGIQLVPPSDAVAIIRSMLRERREELVRMAGEHDTGDLTLHALAHCEHQAQRLILHCKPPDLAAVNACVAMIKTVLRGRPVQGGRRCDDHGMAGLVEAFRSYAGARDDESRLEAGTASMIKMAAYDPARPRGLRPADFPVFRNEGHEHVSSTFTKHGILTEPEAIKRVCEGRSSWAPADLGSRTATAAESAASALNHCASVFYVWFNANRHRAADFAVPDGCKVPIRASELKEFAARFPSTSGSITCCGEMYFEGLARDQFGERYDSFAHNFVASADNPGAFPAFLRSNGEVIVARRFVEMCCDALIPVLDKQEFDRLNESRSKAYEAKAVPAHFEKLGYEYRANVKAKGVGEIDGIAVSDAEALVIEAKCWIAPKMAGGPRSRDHLTLKIKDGIDGTRHEIATGKVKRKHVPLRRKVDWVDRNRAGLKIKEGVPVRGMLVINAKPPVREYEGCEIRFVDDQMH